MAVNGGYRYCPECGAEYRAGFDRCYDCNVELADEPPPEPEEVEFDPEAVPRLVQVFAASRMEADVVRAALESYGIPALLAKEGYTAAYPVNVGGFGEGRVLVPEERAEEALEVIGSLDEEEEPVVLAAGRPVLDRSWVVWVAAVVMLALVVFFGIYVPR